MMKCSGICWVSLTVFPERVHSMHFMLKLRTVEWITYELKFRCIQHRALHLTQLCPIQLENKVQQCGHCRFRKAFFIFKTLARTKLVQSIEVPRVNQISMLMYNNSDAIVKFCIGKIEEKLDLKCITELQKEEIHEIKPIQQV